LPTGNLPIGNLPFMISIHRADVIQITQPEMLIEKLKECGLSLFEARGEL
jgi:hypothetical protein